ncbi:MAG TPA: glutamate--tRNA ligase [Candidatus Saccharicenans sp.]|jgi:glutamyl-tRNA synthetase|nr:glutamate--tRNA ligase [Candidatus Saccharicenans sp.]HOJ25878.1 glutamate--tRNA ligase [Candidatus Saccharicenans sp.]HOL45046.1 glutamate--tRNA ligase [Candidatus Saccharicenans sp.]HOM93465.1 glutamate--tRNA ligase [Candidatus Saccharicenans sp.]HOP60408.1 glutamate--tRNA ligase [Candidatus Saccharicenans sp.]
MIRSDSTEKIRVRFAPSPTGFIHVGNARTALFNWLLARQKGGVFVLRVEDTDIERSKPEYEKNLIEDLRWLGLDWDEGPDVGGEFGPYRQSERLELYHQYARQLLENGQAYYCFCPQEELERQREEALAQGRSPAYSGRCRNIPLEKARRRLESGEQAAIRLKVPEEGLVRFNDLVRGEVEFDLKLIGDPIIVRSNGMPAYNFSVVIDDALMHITHVVRGEDHISNTPRQILLYQAFNWPLPVFAHLSMVMGKDNTRLSKRHGATSIDQFRREGVLPQALCNYLAFLGWSPPEGKEVLTLEELVSLFDLSHVNRAAAIFDYDKLYWLNRQHIKLLPPSKKLELALPYLKEAGLVGATLGPAEEEWLSRVVELLLEGVDKFSDLPQKFSLIFDFQPEALAEEAREIISSDSARKVLQALVQKTSDLSDFNYEVFARLTGEIKKETGIKGKELYHPLRVMLTARASGLELDKFIPLVEEGARLNFPRPIKNCLQRIREFACVLGIEPAGKPA